MNHRGMSYRNYTRRHFVQAGLYAGAAAALPAETSRNIYWGLGLVTWRSRGSGWPDILHDVSEAGFDGVEPFTPKFLNDEAMNELAELLPKYPRLRMSSIYWSGPFNVVAEHEHLIEDSRRILGYLKRFGSDRLTFGPPRPQVDDEKIAIANTAAIANKIGRISLEEFGIRTDIHPHVGSLIENPRQIDMLMDQTDPKYFNLGPDTAQIWMGGGDPVAFFEKYRNRIIYMHYKDIRGYYRGLPGYLDNVVELGRGIIDFPALHRILKSVHYKGWITIDLDNARISPLESSKVEKEYIDRVLAPIYA
jgi:inosose dehydratase